MFNPHDWHSLILMSLVFFPLNSTLGERRIRVHTLCIPVTNQLSEVFSNADQQAVVALLSKMGK